jgi:uncharacterized protein YggE
MNKITLQEVLMKSPTMIFKYFLPAGLFILLFLASLSVASAQPTMPASAPQPISEVSPICDPSRTVQVNGTALVNVSPDRAMIQLGVQSNGVTTDEVERTNSTSIQKVIKTLQTQGIDAKDISTDVYVIEPVYESYDSLYIKGYRINNMVAVTLRDVKKTSKVIAAALKAGANQVVNVEFYTSDLRRYRDQARELAMRAAKEKAQALAGAAGAEAGCALNITENSWSYYNGWYYGRSQNLWTQNTVQNATLSNGEGTGSGTDEPISLGQISVKAEVTATFSLK